MSVHWLFAIEIVAIRIGVPLAFAGPITILLRRSLSARVIGTFNCFAIVLSAVFILQTVAAIWLRR
jgi:hypothetical protein